MPKRILIVSQHYWPENFRVTDLAAGFLADGLEVDVLCGLPNYPKGEWFAGYRYTGPRHEVHDGVEIFRAGEIPRRGNRGAMIFLNYVSWPVFALFSLPRLRKRHYDAVFCYNTSPVLMGLPAIRLARRRGIPLTTYVLDLWPENLYSVLPVKNRFLRNLAQRVSNRYYRRADRLIAMSDSLKTHLMRVGNKRDAEVAVIPQYCEDFYAVPCQDAQLAARFGDRFNLVFTGNFSPAQSLDTVVRAVCLAKKECEKLHLLLVGDGMSRASLEALCADLDANDFITFYGSVPPTEIPRFTTLADALLISLNSSPDLGMTVPAKLASYMAAGKPILASMNGEGAAAVQQAGCGFTGPAADVEALAKNIVAMYRLPPEQRAVLGAASFAAWQAHFQRKKLLLQLEAFIMK